MCDKQTRPKCQVPYCSSNAQLITSLEKWRFRKASWVAEKYDCEGYVCQKHHSINYGMGGWDYKIYRKDYCENIDGRLGFTCTYTAPNKEQLEVMNNVELTFKGWLQVDHIDGNHKNNKEENLQTLCACCHTIKTAIYKDYLTPGRKTLKELV